MINLRAGIPFLPAAIVAIITIAIFSLFIKGDKGNPIAFQSTHDARVEGPFETSNNNSRYALVEAIVNHRSFFFNTEQARFAAPDLINYNGKFFSIFTPGVSFAGIPFYLIGKYFGLPQLLTYFSSHLFAFINVFLVALLTLKLGGKLIYGALSGLVFLFGTNALPYALTFTQHQASTSLILLGILNSLGKRTLVTNILFGAIFGMSILMDVPNIFLLLPPALYILGKNFVIKNLTDKVKFGLKISIIGLFLGLAPFITLYGWYNYQTTGSYTKIVQFIGRSNYPAPLKEIERKEVPKEEKNTQPSLFDTPFNTRLQANGLYILLLSNERGIVYFSPILIIGLIGLITAYRIRLYKNVTVLLFSVILMNIILYSMFHDPWGGWAFGPRYLIPASALLSVGVGIAVLHFIRKPLFTLAFFVLLIYSVGISSAGALTTNAIPPKGEAQNLINAIPYTYAYNFQFIEKNQSSSLLYNLFFSNFVSLRSFWYILVSFVITAIAGLYAYALFKKGEWNTWKT